jgi:hypothetical protein
MSVKAGQAYWSNAGQTLVKHWSSTGQTLAQSRATPLPPAALSETSAGQTLVKRWMYLLSRILVGTGFDQYLTSI